MNKKGVVALIGGNAFRLDCREIYGLDPDLCWFFEHDREARIRAAAKDAFAANIKDRARFLCDYSSDDLRVQSSGDTSGF